MKGGTGKRRYLYLKGLKRKEPEILEPAVKKNIQLSVLVLQKNEKDQELRKSTSAESGWPENWELTKRVGGGIGACVSSLG